MSMSQLGPGFRLSAPADFDSEVELLQTDVMRFVAMLGIVLMAIFALVQSLPFTSRDSRPKIENQAALRQDLAKLDAYVEARRDELRGLQAEIVAALAFKDRLVQQSAAARAQLESALEQAKAVNLDLNQDSGELVRIRQDLDRENQALSLLRAKTESKREDLRRTQVRIGVLSEQVRETEARRAAQIEEQKAKQAQPPRELQKPAQEVRATAAPAEPEAAAEVPKRGFTLKFESESAFNRLVAENSVAFYALAGTRAWRASRLGRVTQFASAQAPKRYYEMAPATVPDSFIRSFKIVAAIHGKNAVTWAVVLPEPLIRAIGRQVENKTGADIVIQENGAIRLEHVQS